MKTLEVKLSEFNAHYFIRKPIANQDLIQYVKEILEIQ